jgi:cholesterol oxidase
VTNDGFDHEVTVIGSDFGGSMADLHAAEKGLRLGMLESRMVRPDEQIPTTNCDLRTFVWQPESEMFSIQRIEFLDDVMVLCGAGAGGSSHVYGNTLHVPPSRMLGVLRVPYMDTRADRIQRAAAAR